MYLFNAVTIYIIKHGKPSVKRYEITSARGYKDEPPVGDDSGLNVVIFSLWKKAADFMSPTLYNLRN